MYQLVFIGVNGKYVYKFFSYSNIFMVRFNFVFNKYVVNIYWVLYIVIDIKIIWNKIDMVLVLERLQIQGDN